MYHSMNNKFILSPALSWWWLAGEYFLYDFITISNIFLCVPFNEQQIHIVTCFINEGTLPTLSVSGNARVVIRKYQEIGNMRDMFCHLIHFLASLQMNDMKCKCMSFKQNIVSCMMWFDMREQSSNVTYHFHRGIVGWSLENVIRT